MSMFSDVGIVFLMVTQELSVCFRNELLVLACDFFFFNHFLGVEGKTSWCE